MEKFDDLVDKLNGTFFWNNQAHKFGVIFSEIIGLTNFVEKLVDNLVTKLGEQFGLTFMLKIL